MIARDVLRWLNEGGDKTLAPRREVIKRVSEFEDFSTCYESDRYKAQGLVAQIQKVVNVKDSFTRINLERERERKHRQELHVASIKAKQKEAEERAVIKDSLYKLFAETDPYKRGKRLEGILNSLFSLAGFLIREAFTVRGDEGQGIIEQTDGAVEIDGMLYLVEMKWWDKPIGDRKLPRTSSASMVGGMSVESTYLIRGTRPLLSKIRRRGWRRKFSFSPNCKKLSKRSSAKPT